jgi:hypothetical protein
MNFLFDLSEFISYLDQHNNLTRNDPYENLDINEDELTPQDLNSPLVLSKEIEPLLLPQQFQFGSITNPNNVFNFPQQGPLLEDLFLIPLPHFSLEPIDQRNHYTVITQFRQDTLPKEENNKICNFRQLTGFFSSYIIDCVKYNETKLFKFIIEANFNNKYDIVYTNNKQVFIFIAKNLTEHFNKMFILMSEYVKKVNSSHSSRREILSEFKSIKKLFIISQCYLNYGPHILIEKLLKLSAYVNLNIDRTHLNHFDTNVYGDSLITQIRSILLSINIENWLKKEKDDDIIFPTEPESGYPMNYPFQVIIH